MRKRSSPWLVIDSLNRQEYMRGQFSLGKRENKRGIFNRYLKKAYTSRLKLVFYGATGYNGLIILMLKRIEENAAICLLPEKVHAPD
jgi:hypothetical protein